MPVSEKEDPIIEGRRLSSWLEVYPHTGAQPLVPTPDGSKRSSPEEREDFYRTAFGEEVAEAHRVLLAAGGDAFPLLIRVLSERETRLQRWRGRVRGLIERHVVQKTPLGYYVPREQAITALLDLQRAGCDIEPVLPEIEKLAKDSDQQTSEAARFLLDRIERERRTRKRAGVDDGTSGQSDLLQDSSGPAKQRSSMRSPQFGG